jgi:cytochrome c1
MRRLITLIGLALLASCGGGHRDQVARAKALIASHCAACHRVPGVAVATGRVGPSLAHIASQHIIAGYFANSPDMLTEWIEHPQKLLPGNAMPDTALSRADAATIVDYLDTME